MDSRARLGKFLMKLMVDGLIKKQIADRLDLNLHTVDYLMRCIYRKLHVNCLASAVSLAVKERLVQMSVPLTHSRKLSIVKLEADL